MLKIVGLFCLLINLNHDYHVAVCEVNQRGKKLEVTHKIFIDDFEKLLEKSGGVRLLLGNPNEHQQAKKLIGEFVSKYFSLQLNNKYLALTYLGYEVENDQLFVYYETVVPNKISSLKVHYSLLFDLFADQANLVHLSIQGKKQSLFIDADKPTATSSW